jgi:hypothetical protein
MPNEPEYRCPVCTRRDEGVPPAARVPCPHLPGVLDVPAAPNPTPPQPKCWGEPGAKRGQPAATWPKEK